MPSQIRVLRLNRPSLLIFLGGLLLLSAILAFFQYNSIDLPSRIAVGGQPTSVRSSATYTTTLPSFRHIFVIVLENKDANQIIASPSAPYLNQLAAQYARAANYYAIQHPSLPNYLALTGGDTFGVNSDCTDCFINQDNLATQFEEAGRSWKAYMEAMSSPCFLGDANALFRPLYRQKHNPFIYYDKVRNDPRVQTVLLPFRDGILLMLKN